MGAAVMGRGGAGLAGALLAAILVSGCGDMPVMGRSPVDKVTARAGMGPPTDVRFGPDGETIWEYARGPAGLQTYALTFDAAGRVVDIAQLLSEDALDRAHLAGASAAEVRRKLGRPGDIRLYPRTEGEVWLYRMKDNLARPSRVLVEFGPDGHVRGISRFPETPGVPARGSGPGDGGHGGGAGH